MSKNKKPTPDIADILELFDKELAPYRIGDPASAKKKAEADLEDQEKKFDESIFRDFTTIQLGDYINAVHAFNREMMGNKLEPHQQAVYFTLFAFEERVKRIADHYTYIN